jgi:DNA helicase-4
MLVAFMVDSSILLPLVVSSTLVVATIYFITRRRIRARARRSLLGFKNEILQAEKEFVSMFNSSQYFSKRDLHLWSQRWNPIARIVRQFAGKNNLGLDFQNSIDAVADFYQRGQQLREGRNAAFVEKEILKFKDLFDNVEDYPLTEEQRKAIVVDEQHNLIVAGAGTGKTSTIIGKAFYLVKKELVKPEEILILSFNSDIVEELKNRINSQLGNGLSVRTYHSLGYEIIAKSEGVKPPVSKLAEDELELQKKIPELIKTRVKDESFAKIVNDYTLFHFTPSKCLFEFQTMGEYADYLRRYAIRSLKGDMVKSFEECDIANFLYSKGVDYEYEKYYEVKLADVTHRLYKPDFFLPKYKIYIEHFGIDREGRTASYISQEKYKEDMKWKRNVHREHKTTLIETYSYERQEGKLLGNLEEKLYACGVEFNPKPPEQLFNELNKLGKIDPFALLISTFLNLFKSCSKTIEELEKSIDSRDARKRAFLEIFSKVYEDYTSYLQRNNEIDFNDMINKATGYVKQSKYKSKYKYILVDEFQDISQGRYRFLVSLLDQNSAKLFCVGDDWQSIYRFAGSDLSIMLDFERNFEFCERNLLEETFRLNDKLCEFSTKFILKNPNQIKKHITSKKKAQKAAVTVIIGKTEEVLIDIISEIGKATEGNQNIFIIGRYNYLKPKNLQLLQGMYPRISVEFTTAHSSKGLEADFVIIIGLESEVRKKLGFPCQMTDDPILNMVLAKEDLTPNAEERRLFYVATTRARNRVYLVVDSGRKASDFISEIENDKYEMELRGCSGKSRNCPNCKTGKIVLRRGAYGEFYSCSNYPYCNYKEHEGHESLTVNSNSD